MITVDGMCVYSNFDAETLTTGSSWGENLGLCKFSQGAACCVQEIQYGPY